jgi:hypothetical protein
MAADPFAEYKFLIQDTARLSDRRQTVNNIYLSVNSVLLGALALLVPQGGLRSLIVLVIVLLVAIAGAIICRDWQRLVHNYKELLKVRFEMLKAIESLENFPYPVKIYHQEDVALYTHAAHSKHIMPFGFSAVELKLPSVFRNLYLIGGLLLFTATMLVRYGAIAYLVQHGILPQM